MNPTFRKDVNDLVLRINAKIEDTVRSNQTDQAALVNLDHGFDGHGFCEPNESQGTIGNIKQRVNSWF